MTAPLPPFFSFFAAVQPRRLAWPDYAALAAYFALNLGIGWWQARRKRRSSTEYFLGERRLAWWAAAISFLATAASSITFMALPAKTYSSDWMSFGSAPAQALGGILGACVFVGILRRLNLVTVFAYLEQRFDRRVRLLGAGLAILLKVGGRMSVIMLLPALALSTVTGLSVNISIIAMGGVTTLYALEGGFEAVVWTDVVQVAVTLCGVVIALSFVGGGVPGGLVGVFHRGAAAGKFQMVSWSLDPAQPSVWAFVGMFFAAVFVQIGDQPLMQRMLATSDAGQAKRTVITGNLIGIASSLIFFFVGTSLWAFYRSHPERLAPALPNDAIFPYFIVNELPHGVIGLIIAGLFASAMGALSSNLNATAAIVVSDFQGILAPAASERRRLRLARAATIAGGAFATAMAVYIAHLGVASLWDQFLKLIALIGGGFPGVFALGLMTRRATSFGVIVGALASIAVTWWVQNYTDTTVFLHGFVATASCMAVGYAVSFFPGQTRRADLTGLTLWTPGPAATGQVAAK